MKEAEIARLQENEIKNKELQEKNKRLQEEVTTKLNTINDKNVELAESKKTIQNKDAEIA